MTLITSAQPSYKRSLLATILISGLIVGTFDLTAASIQTLIYHRSPIKMFQYVASGVFGKEAMEDGNTAYAVHGVLFHYCIAMIWTVLFFLIYPKIPILSKNRVVTGIVYGIFIWTIMARVVLPLSNTPAGVFNLKNAIIAASILSVAIGIPLSFIANKYYRKNNGDRP